MVAFTSPAMFDDLAEIVQRDLPWQQFANSTVLVTGASGMLPSYAAYTLLALNDRYDTGIQVRGLVRNEQKARRILGEVLHRGDFELIVADVGAALNWDGDLDYVIHGASPARPALHGADPVSTMKANLLGTLSLLDLCVRKGSRGFLLMSSAEVYGSQPEGTVLIDENSYGGFDILNPRACYSESKRAAETLCAVYQAQHKLTSRIVRFGHIYGPGMALDDGRVQADFAADVVAERDIVLNSDGAGVRTYTYVADAVAGMFYALLVGNDTVYNVSDARGLVSVRELATLFTQLYPERELRVRFTNATDERAYSPAIGQGLSSARLEALGWTARVDLAAGLARMIAALEYQPGS